MVYCFEYNQRILITAPYTLEGRRYCGQLRERNAKYQKVSYKIRIWNFWVNLPMRTASTTSDIFSWCLISQTRLISPKMDNRLPSSSMCAYLCEYFFFYVFFCSPFFRFFVLITEMTFYGSQTSFKWLLYTTFRRPPRSKTQWYDEIGTINDVHAPTTDPLGNVFLLRKFAK